MRVDAALVFSFAMVFIRCSAMLMSSPIFGTQNTPVMIRIFTTMAISGALTLVLQPHIGPVPENMYGLLSCTLQEAVAGLLLGSFVSLALQAAQIAGTIMDTQLGLGMSQVLNPVSGISVSILSQYKNLLAMVILLQSNGHHILLAAFARSYTSMPALSMNTVTTNLAAMLGAVFFLAIQIAAPVMGISMIIDAALGLISKAVPQMPVFIVGMPAKVGIGLIATGLTVPMLVASVSTGVQLALDHLAPIFHM